MHLVNTFVAVLFLTILSACNTKPIDTPQTKISAGKSALETITLLTESGTELSTELAISHEDQVRGLSGRQSNEFGGNQAMLFFYDREGTRSFWMPDTYFNLDIIMINKDLKVTDIHKNVPAHPGRSEPPAIARTPPVWAQHVLEIRADAPAAREIKVGTKFRIKGSTKSLSEIVREIRP